MMEFKESAIRLDNEMHKAVYIDHRYDRLLELWSKIKDNTEILKASIEVTRDKFDEKDMFVANFIVEQILINYKDVDYNVYQSLVDKLYGNTDLARIVLDGYSNGGYSFLLMTLWNPNLTLTQKQKEFVIDEAMNKIGTTRYHQLMNDYRVKLKTDPRTKDDQTVIMEFGGVSTPVGIQAAHQWWVSQNYSLSDTQAHGVGAFDIRYWILRNNNFSDEEGKHLIHEFFPDKDCWNEILNELEWGIVNEDDATIGIDDVLFIDDSEVIERLGLERGQQIIEEISFVRKLHDFRPAEWEEEIEPKVMVKKL
jgi:hypothetical protein